MPETETKKPAYIGGILDNYMTPQECADELHCRPITLAVWRMKGEGPPYTEVARKIYYHRPGTREWLASRMRRPGAPPRRER